MGPSEGDRTNAQELHGWEGGWAKLKVLGSVVGKFGGQGMLCAEGCCGLGGSASHGGNGKHAKKGCQVEAWVGAWGVATVHCGG